MSPPAPKRTSAKKQEKRKAKPKFCLLCEDVELKPQDPKYKIGKCEFDNAMVCPNNHKVCFECVAQILEPARKEQAKDAGVGYKCPLCRSLATVDNMTNLSINKRSRAKAVRSFTEDGSITSSDERADVNGVMSIWNHELAEEFATMLENASSGTIEGASLFCKAVEKEFPEHKEKFQELLKSVSAELEADLPELEESDVEWISPAALSY